MGGQVLDYETKKLIRTGMSEQSAKDIQKLAEYLKKVNPGMSDKEALEEAEKVLNN